jgi:hypothetical protein
MQRPDPAHSTTPWGPSLLPGPGPAPVMDQLPYQAAGFEGQGLHQGVSASFTMSNTQSCGSVPWCGGVYVYSLWTGTATAAYPGPPGTGAAAFKLLLLPGAGSWSGWAATGLTPRKQHI